MGWIRNRIQDIAVLAGFASIGYGLHLVAPWAAYVACGAFLMVFGLLNPKDGTKAKAGD